MAKAYAQHATAGKYHLETHYDGHQWEWWANTIKSNDGPNYANTSYTLEDAKKSAERSIGLMLSANWEPIGPELDIPD